MITLGIIGFPFVGKKTLARAIADTGVARLMVPGSIAAYIERHETPAAIAAHDQVRAGVLLSDEAIATLWSECTPEDADVVAAGLPKGAAQYRAYLARQPRDLWLLHLRTEWDLLVARMEARGAGNIDGHPGARQRLTTNITELASLSRRDGRYLELEAFRPLPEMLAAVLDTIWHRR
ncbi:MAG: hypothetical protein R3B72_26470 [Polyangiaceae bacterium]